MHPASHSCPMERRDPLASSSNTWACVAVSGRSGMLRLQVWVDCMVALFGSSTWIPLLVAFTLVMGMALWMYWCTGSASRKCHVAAVSATSGLRLLEGKFRWE